MEYIQNYFYKKTKKALILNAILSAPMFSMCVLSSFILRKDLNATLFHLAILAMLKPSVSFFSYFWSSYIFDRSDKLKKNYLWATFFSVFLFLLFPLFNGVWAVILATCMYMLFYRAKNPAWLEIVKLNITKEKRDKIYAYTSSLGYLIGTILAFVLGKLFKENSGIYKEVYFVSAVLVLVNLFIISKIPINLKNTKPKPGKKIEIIKPIKEGILLFKSNPEFKLFQKGFMIAGFGLMLIQPVIIIFAVDFLKISHGNFFFAILIFKDMAFVLTSPIWGSFFNKIPLMKLSSYMFLTFFLFMIILPFSLVNMVWFYIAFIIYGIASSGSHLLWNMSSLVFSKDENSSKYTAVGSFLSALRGAVAPMLGSFLAIFISPVWILIMGSIFCLYSFYLIFQNQKAVIPEKNN